MGFEFTSEREKAVFKLAFEGRVTRRLEGPLRAGVGLDLLLPVVRDHFYYADEKGPDREMFDKTTVRRTNRQVSEPSARDANIGIRLCAD